MLLAVALLAYFLLSGDEEASAESKYDGVHLCSPSQQEAATAAAGRSGAALPTPSGNLDLEPSRIKGPFFAQNGAPWAGEEYDHATRQDVGCGKTLAQCGCAMTSVGTVLALFQLVTTPTGDELNPASLNSWFNEGAQLTGDGWVSQGYVYGNVVWTAVNNFSAGVPGANGAKSVRYVGWGNGSEDEIKGQLAKGLPVVLEVPGHFIAAVGLQGDEILINDPFYADRTTLSSYKGLVKSSRLYEPGEDLSAVMISVPSNQRVKVTDSQGREVGTLGGKNPQDAEDSAKNEIPGATYHFEAAWRDPTCTEKPPEDGQGVNTIFLPDPQDGNYTVEVLDAQGKSTSAAVYVYDERGALRMITRGGGGRLQFDFSFGSGGGGGGGPGPSPTPTETPTPTPTPTPEPEEATAEEPEEATVEEPDDVAPITPTFTLTPTNTPTVTPTVTPVPAPAMSISPMSPPNAVSSSIAPSPGCRTPISWTAGGDPKGKVELLRNSQPIYTGGIGPVTFNDPFAPGTWTYVVRATNSDGVVTSSAPIQVTPTCLTEYRMDIVDTCGECSDVRHLWTVLGNQAGTVTIIHTPDGVVVATRPLSSSSYIATTNYNCPNDYRIVVTVGNGSVSSPVVRTPGGFFSNCND